MKVRPLLIGIVAGLVLPLASANARAVVDPGLNPAGAGMLLERGAARTAENFGRHEDEDKGDNDHKGDKDRKDDRDHHRGDNDDHKGDRSPCKP